MANLTAVNGTNFEAEVLQSSTPVLVDFSATWCGPCKKLTPIVEGVAQEFGERAKVVTVDIDQAQDLAAQFGVMSVPTLIFFAGGEAKQQLVGVQSPETISGILTELGA